MGWNAPDAAETDSENMVRLRPSCPVWPGRTQEGVVGPRAGTGLPPMAR